MPSFSACSNGGMKLFPEISRSAAFQSFLFSATSSRSSSIAAVKPMFMICWKLFSSSRAITRPSSVGFRRAFFFDGVVAALNLVHDRRIGRRTSDARFFQFFDERGFGIARRGACEGLFGGQIEQVAAACPSSRWRQHAAFIVFFIVIAFFFIDGQETLEI